MCRDMQITLSQLNWILQGRRKCGLRAVTSLVPHSLYSRSLYWSASKNSETAAKITQQRDNWCIVRWTLSHNNIALYFGLSRHPEKTWFESRNLRPPLQSTIPLMEPLTNSLRFMSIKWNRYIIIIISNSSSCTIIVIIIITVGGHAFYTLQPVLDESFSFW